MRIENGMLVLEPAPCRECRHYADLLPGFVRSPIHGDCAACRGTGYRGRGRCSGCHGRGTQVVSYTEVPCPRCGGDPVNKDVDCYTDYAPEEAFTSQRFVVYRSGREQTMNESLIGLGCFYSVTDYGDHAKLTDDELIEKVRSGSGRHQGCKYVRSKDDLRMCDHIGIFTNHNGYSVRPVFTEDGIDAKATILSERPYDEGMAVGMAIAAEGGNGTLGGLYR